MDVPSYLENIICFLVQHIQTFHPPICKESRCPRRNFQEEKTFDGTTHPFYPRSSCIDRSRHRISAMPLSVHLVINLHLCACPILHVGGTRQIKGGIREESLYTMEWPFTELDELICNLNTPSSSQKSLFRGARCYLPTYWNDLSFVKTSKYNNARHHLLKPEK